MIRRSFRWGLLLGLLGGVAVTVMKVLQSKREPLPEPVVFTPTPVPDPTPAPEPVADETLPAPAPIKRAPAGPKPAGTSTPWVEPVDGGCPGSHPVKAKLSSGIFHLPTGFNYARTRPDRCYIDAAAAEADGLRPSKR